MSRPAVAVAAMAKMIEIRDEQKRQLGIRYAEAIEPLRVLIRGFGIDNMEELRRTTQAMRFIGHDPSLLIAAFVEESGL